MMCGCGSTGEREPLTVLSLFRSPRAPCCIPVHCAYFGNSCSAPFFCLTVYSLCAALALFFPALCLPRSASTFLSPSPLLQIVLLCFPFSFLGLVRSYCCDCKLSFLQNKRKKEGKWGRREIMVFTTWLTARPSNGSSLETQHYSLSSTVLSECIV